MSVLELEDIEKYDVVTANQIHHYLSETDRRIAQGYDMLLISAQVDEEAQRINDIMALERFDPEVTHMIVFFR